MLQYLGILAACGAVAGGAALGGWWLARRRRQRLAAARKLFHQRREWLEARFVELASASGKPRGLRWKECDFSDAVTFARDRQTGGLTALAAVTISFEAIEGEGMEEVEAVGNLRAATAVFQYGAGQWSTQGRAIMNLEPAEAIQRFHRALESIGD
ncbi:MAG: hypothetical protein GTO03_04600 [Planctomycetales bacterium]|nr:hypothetical protein [Planctomycetales bacterium]